MGQDAGTIDKNTEAEMLRTGWRASPNRAPTALSMIAVGTAALYAHVPPLLLWPWVALCVAYVVVIRVITLRDRGASEERRAAYQDRLDFFIRNVMVGWAILWAAIALLTFWRIPDQAKLIVSLVMMQFCVAGVTYTPSLARRALWIHYGTLVVGWAVWGQQHALLLALSFFLSLMMFRGASFALERIVRDQYRLRDQSRQMAAELAARNEQLTTTNTLKSRLIATASHDLRQPVHALGLLMETWDYKPERETHEQRLGVARSHVGLLDDMLRSLLDASRLDMGIYQPLVTRFSLPALLHELVSGHEAVARRKGLTLNFENRLTGERPWLVSDRGMLGRVLSNLLGNAIRYTAAGGVRLAAAPEGDGVRIEVEDSGPGVALGDAASFFEAFTRLRNPARSEGLGIGLAVVEKGIAALGIAIEVDSAPGRGSRFVLRIPGELVTSEHAPSAPAPLPALPEGGGPVARVLVIEDDPVGRDAMVEVLHKWGFEARAAEDGERAVTIAGDASWVPDLIVSDYQLGGQRNGLEAVIAVRELYRRPGLPALLVTGSFEMELAPLALQQQVRVLQKPVRPSLLRETLEQLLAG